MSQQQEGGPKAAPAEKAQDRAKNNPQSVPPEADPALNNPDATPGTGMLPTIGEDDPNPQPSS